MERPVGGSDNVASRHPSAFSNQGLTDEAIGGPEAARMVDAHEQRADNRAHERHHAVGRCSDEVAIRSVVFDSPIPRPVGPMRKTERIEHRSIGRRRQGELPRRYGHSRGREQEPGDHGDDS